MLYEKYQKRMARVAKILKMIRRFSGLIIAVVATAIVSAASFMAVQGVVFTKTECKTEIYYGDTQKYEAGAIFGSVQYEYASALHPDRWYRQVPTIPGDYLVRAVSKSTFGTPRYGKVQEFKIVPRPIDVTVAGDEVLYGETPTAQSEGLAYDDTVSCNDYVYADITLDNTKINANKNSVVIKDKDGKDVTAYYVISTPEKDIRIVEKNITVTVSDANSIYNDLPLEFDGYEVSEATPLVNGDVIYATIDSSITDVGSTTNEATSWIVINSDNKDVTEHYNITQIKGTLTVKQRPIVIKPGGASFVYDGTTKYCEDFEIISGNSTVDGEDVEGYPLVEGHKVVVYQRTEISIVQSTPNVLKFKVYDSEDKEVSSNYSFFVMEDQILEITKRPVTLVTSGDTWTYDDQFHENSDYTIGGDGLAEGHSTVYTEKHSIRDVGETENKVTLSILDENGVDVTANYELTYQYGILKIEPIVLSAVTDSGRKTYDGMALSAAGYAIINENALLAGHVHSYRNSTAITDVQFDGENNVSDVANKVNLQIITPDGRDVSGNYVLEYGENDVNAGRLQIDPREITVETHSHTFVYNGVAQSFAELTGAGENQKGFAIIDGTLAEGQSIRANLEASASVTHVSDGAIANKLVFEFLDGEGNTIPRSNYIVHCSDDKTGKIEVVPLELVITTQSNNFVYDGIAHTYAEENAGYTITSGALPEGHALSLVSSTQVLEYTPEPVKNELNFVLKMGENEVADADYNITYVYGDISVSKRPISFVANTADKIYDGTALVDGGYSIVDDETNEFDALANSHTVGSISVVGSQTLADSSANVISNAVILSGETDVTSNYEITYVNGTLTVDKRPITVTTSTDEWIYDSLTHSNTGFVISDNTDDPDDYLAEGQSAKTTDTYTTVLNFADTGADGTDNVVPIVITYMDGEEEVDVTSNYEITYVYGTLKIIKRPISIITNTDKWVYDGQEHYNDGYNYADESLTLVDGHFLFFAEASYTKVLGYTPEAVNNVHVVDRIMSGVGENAVDVTDNYDIPTVENGRLTFGTLTVDKRPIKISTATSEWIYDGRVHFNDNYTVLPADDVYLDVVSGERTEILNYTSVLNVWDLVDGNPIENKLDIGIFNANNEDVSVNYDITYDYGTLTLNKRQITVATNDGRWMYNDKEYSNTGLDDANGGFTVGGDGLGDTLYISIVESSSVKYVKDTGKLNEIKVKLYLDTFYTQEVDERNYTVTYTDKGTFTVDIRPIRIETASDSWTYNGLSHSNDNFYVLDPIEGFYGIAGNDVISLGTSKTITNVWESGDNDLTVVIMNGETDVTENYELHYEYGTVSVERRVMNVQTLDGEWIYDGEYHSNTGLNNTNGGYVIYGDGLCDSLFTGIVESSSVKYVRDSQRSNIISLKLYLNEDCTEEVDERNYEFIYDVYGTFTILQRDIRVSTPEYEWVYDATEHFMTNGVAVMPATGSYLDLVDGDVIEIVDYTKVTNVWDSGENFVSVIVMDGDEDVTENYNIKYERGYLTVRKRIITVQTLDGKWVYDGEYHSNSGLNVENGGFTVGEDGLCDTLFIKILTATDIKYFDESGKLNEITLGLYLNEDCTDEVDERNYEFIYDEKGTLNIDKRKIKVETASDEWIYDGLRHYNNNFTVLPADEANGYYDVVVGETTFSSLYSTVTNVWDARRSDAKENQIVVDIFDGKLNVSNNYDIDYVYGTLIIDPRPIMIETESQSWVYDGIEHSHPIYGVITGSEGYYDLVAGHATVEDEVTYITDKGIKENTLKIYVYDGSKDISENYDIDYAFGELEITQRHLTVDTFDGEWIYDGKDHSNTGLDVVNGGYSIGGDGLGSYLYAEIVESTSVKNFKDSGKLNEIVVKLYLDPECTIEVDADNYEIEYTSKGTLTIKQRPIFVITPDGEWIYDGVAHANTEFVISVPEGEVYLNIVNGHNAAAVENTVDYVTNVWESGAVNRFDISITDEMGEDVTENYDITYKYGTLTVLQRHITVQTLTGSWMYDGEWHSNAGLNVENGGFTVGGDGLCDTLFIGIVSASQIKNVWESGMANDITVALYLDRECQTEVDVRNYTVDYDEHGTLNITKRPIFVETGSQSWMYDGEAHSNGSFVVVEGLEGYYGLVSGQIAKAYGVQSVTNVWEARRESPFSNVFDILISDADGEDVTRNYKIEYEPGTLIIDPRPIVVQTGSGEWMYDGEAHSNGYVVVLPADEANGIYSILNGHKAISEEDKLVKVTNVWDAPEESPRENDITVRIMSALGDMTENYAITYNYGTLVIKPRPIKVTSQGGEWTYDGIAHYNPNAEALGAHFDYESLINYYTLLAGHSVTVVDYTSVTNVNETLDKGADNVVTIKIVDAAQEDMTANYAITYVYGKLKINPRKITVDTFNGEWTYDGEYHSNTGLDVVNGGYSIGGDGLGSYLYAEIVESTSVKNFKDSGKLNEIVVKLYLDPECTIEVDADNYEIEYISKGTLTIKQRPIFVITPDGEWIYDGVAHANTEFVISVPEGEIYLNIVNGHNAAAVENTVDYVTNVWESGILNEFDVVITDEAGADVTENYDITYKYGTLTVLQRHITVQTLTGSWMYDGEYHYNEGLNEENGGFTVGGDGLCDTLFIDIVDANRIQNVWESGMANDITVALYLDSECQTEVDKRNYTVDYDKHGTLNITKRPILVETGSQTWTYDGQDHFNKDFMLVEGTDKYYGLVLDHKLVLVSYVTVRNVWDVYEENNCLVLKVVDGTGDSKINQNYDIKYRCGTLKIDPKPIDVTTGSKTWKYDGNAHSYPYFDLNKSELIDGQVAVLDKYAEYVNAGEYDNVIEIKVEGPDGDMTRNYKFNFTHGKLVITPIKIQVSTGSGEWIYDGEYHSNSHFEILSPSGEYEGLFDGHVAVLGKSYEIANAWESGDNKLEIAIMSGEEDVTQNYEITYQYGTLTIKPINLRITADSDTKIYDGKPLMTDGYSTEGLINDHVVGSVTVIGSQTVAGKSGNVPSQATILDGAGNDVTRNYNIEYVAGTLTVTPREIEIIFGSKMFTFDGEEHSYPVCDAFGQYTLAEGDTLAVAPGAAVPAIINPGSVHNIFDIAIYNESGVDVTDSYIILTAYKGTLTVIGDILKIKGTETGPVYLKYESFGDYTGQGWLAAPQYMGLLAGMYPYNYLSSAVLAEMGYREVVLEVSESIFGGYLLPYYMSLQSAGYDVPDNDVIFDKNHDGSYTVKYYVYEGHGNDLPSGSHPFASEELAYRKFVYDNYLGLDSVSLDYMNGIIEQENFDANDPLVIQKVARYIQNAAKYDLEYDTKMEDEENVAIAFLDKYKVGVCRHYAAAATLMYRALGIPARYTEGYYGEAIAGEWTSITADKGHAWVEVYIDGVGWIMVEVTGSSDKKVSIDITAKSLSKTYDGTPLVAENALDLDKGNIRQLIDYGYTYKVKVSGSQTEIGKSNATITSFTIFDEHGRDVTSQFEIIMNDGTLEVKEEKKLTVYLVGISDDYTGEPLEYEPYDYYKIDGLPNGYTIDLQISGSLTNPGVLALEDIVATYIVYNERGEDVSDEFYIEFTGDQLQVNKIDIILQTASERKEYDGTPLTNDTVTVVQGSLIEGHTIKAKVTGSITDVGGVRNTLLKTDVRIYDANGVDVTSYYNIEVEEGYLEVYE